MAPVAVLRVPLQNLEGLQYCRVFPCGERGGRKAFHGDIRRNPDDVVALAVGDEALVRQAETPSIGQLSDKYVGEDALCGLANARHRQRPFEQRLSERLRRADALYADQLDDGPLKSGARAG